MNNHTFHKPESDGPRTCNALLTNIIESRDLLFYALKMQNEF